MQADDDFAVAFAFAPAFPEEPSPDFPSAVGPGSADAAARRARVEVARLRARGGIARRAPRG